MGLFKKNPLSEQFENQLILKRRSLIKGSMAIISRANLLFNVQDDRFILIAKDLIKNNPYLYLRQLGEKLFKSHLIVQIVNSVAPGYSPRDQYMALHHMFIFHLGGMMPDKIIHFPREISINLVKELLSYGENQGYDINGDNSIPPISLLRFYLPEFDPNGYDLIDELSMFWGGIWYGKTTRETVNSYLGMVIYILSMFFYSNEEVARLFKNYLLEKKDGESKLNSYAQLIIDYDAELSGDMDIYKLTHPYKNNL